MAKKNKNKINKTQVEKNMEKYLQYIRMPEYERNRKLANMSEYERADFADFCLAGLAAGIALDTQGTLEEQEKEFMAILDMDMQQILSLKVVCAAIHPKTTKQLHEIIQNINSYPVTLQINDYHNLGLYWKTVLIPLLAKTQAFPLGGLTYEDVGKNLCKLKIAVLTPFGVLWTFENAQV